AVEPPDDGQRRSACAGVRRRAASLLPGAAGIGPKPDSQVSACSAVTRVRPCTEGLYYYIPLVTFLTLHEYWHHDDAPSALLKRSPTCPRGPRPGASPSPPRTQRARRYLPDITFRRRCGR